MMKFTTVLMFLMLELACNFINAWAPPLAPFAPPHSALSMANEAYRGTVKWFDAKKGFGFIVPTDGSVDVFVHQTGIQKDGFRSLKVGESVDYVLAESHEGRSKAIQVTTATTTATDEFAPEDHLALIEEDLMADADEIFRELDVNRDGEVSINELRSHLERMGCSSQVIRGLFTALDTNADGVISLEEMRHAFLHYETSALYTAFGLSSDVTNHAVQQAVSSIRSEAGVDDALKDASPQARKLLADLVFDMLDVDGSGEIDASELCEHFANVNTKDSQVSVNAILSALDIDANGTISRDEMREGVCNYNYRALKKALGLESA